MYYKIMSLWKLSWSLATIPPSSLAGCRRATEQKSESECIDTVCIVHGFMNNIIHNSSCMINIDHWMKDCWSCKINIDHWHERLLIIYHNCWSLDERLLIMYDKHWSLPWKPVDHVSQLLIMYRIVITIWALCIPIPERKAIRDLITFSFYNSWTNCNRTYCV